MRDATELVTIIIPCRNEERYIGACLASVLGFECPDGITFEVLVMDGRSEDRTVALARGIAACDSRVHVLDNPERIQSTAVNLGVRASRGEWIMRLDAHARYPADYLRLCHETARSSGADNVGGIFITEPGGTGYSAQLVQALTTHIFGVGDSGFRTDATEAWADTVPYGFYRRDVFDQLGWLDERLLRAQDYEFNRRIIAAGGCILRSPRIQIHYFNQPTLRAFYRKQFVHEAPYNAYLWYLAPYAFAARHAITGLFALGVLGGLVVAPLASWLAWAYGAVLALYAALAIGAAAQQALRYRRPLHAICLPPCFFLFHFVHGLGLLTGLARLALRSAPVQQKPEPWPGAGFQRVPRRSLKIWPSAATPEDYPSDDHA